MYRTREKLLQYLLNSFLRIYFAIKFSSLSQIRKRQKVQIKSSIVRKINSGNIYIYI